MKRLETKRLILRDMKEFDLDPMAAINADSRVMEFFPATQTRKETLAFIHRVIRHQQKHGYSLYACELKSTGEMIGFVGLLYRSRDELDIPGMPGTEIGWRLAADHWNQGYATEAATAVLKHGFDDYGLNEIVSFTATLNKPSQRVMQKIGLKHNPNDDFDHPNLEKDNPLCQHVLYRIKKKNGITFSQQETTI